MPTFKELLSNKSLQVVETISNHMEGSITKSEIRKQERAIRRRAIKKYVDPENVNANVKRLSSYANAKTRNFLQKAQQAKAKLPEYVNRAQQEFRKVATKEGREQLISNINITQYTQTIKKLAEGSTAGQKLLKLSQNKWFRRSAIGVAIAVGANMLEKSLNGFNAQPAIPKSYERGYDVMNETMTDFGSPVKLAKTAAKIITPYYSSVRKGVVTTTKVVTNKNLSLALSSKAIGHTRY